jgi:hypothetical protein
MNWVLTRFNPLKKVTWKQVIQFDVFSKYFPIKNIQTWRPRNILALENLGNLACVLKTRIFCSRLTISSLLSLIMKTSDKSDTIWCFVKNIVGKKKYKLEGLETFSVLRIWDIWLVFWKREYFVQVWQFRHFCHWSRKQVTKVTQFDVFSSWWF